MDDIKRRKLGNRFVLSGVMIYIANYFLYFFIVTQYDLWMYLWMSFALCICGIVFTVLGGIIRKQSVNDWIVLLGLIMILSTFSLAVLNIVLGGFFVENSWMMPVLLFTGLGFVIVGSLRRNSTKETE